MARNIHTARCERAGPRTGNRGWLLNASACAEAEYDTAFPNPNEWGGALTPMVHGAWPRFGPEIYLKPRTCSHHYLRACILPEMAEEAVLPRSGADSSVAIDSFFVSPSSLAASFFFSCERNLAFSAAGLHRAEWRKLQVLAYSLALYSSGRRNLLFIQTGGAIAIFSLPEIF